MTKPFHDQAGILGLLAGLATFAITASPERQTEIFGPANNRDANTPEKEPSRESLKAAQERASALQKAAENGDIKEYMRNYVELPDSVRTKLAFVVGAIKSGKATVDGVSSKLDSVIKSSSKSFKSGVVRSIHEKLAQNKRTYTGDKIQYATKRKSPLNLSPGQSFALAKRSLGLGYIVQTYNPLKMHIVEKTVIQDLLKNSKTR